MGAWLSTRPMAHLPLRTLTRASLILVDIALRGSRGAFAASMHRVLPLSQHEVGSERLQRVLTHAGGKYALQRLRGGSALMETLANPQLLAENTGGSGLMQCLANPQLLAENAAALGKFPGDMLAEAEADDDPDWQSELGMMYAANDMTEQAERILWRAVERHPAHEGVLLAIAEYLAHWQGDCDQAEAFVHRVLYTNSSHERAHQMLATFSALQESESTALVAPTESGSTALVASTSQQQAGPPQAPKRESIEHRIRARFNERRRIAEEGGSGWERGGGEEGNAVSANGTKLEVGTRSGTQELEVADGSRRWSAGAETVQAGVD